MNSNKGKKNISYRRPSSLPSFMDDPLHYHHPYPQCFCLHSAFRRPTVSQICVTHGGGGVKLYLAVFVPMHLLCLFQCICCVRVIVVFCSFMETEFTKRKNNTFFTLFLYVDVLPFMIKSYLYLCLCLCYCQVLYFYLLIKKLLL